MCFATRAGFLRAEPLGVSFVQPFLHEQKRAGRRRQNLTPRQTPACDFSEPVGRQGRGFPLGIDELVDELIGNQESLRRQAPAAGLPAVAGQAPGAVKVQHRLQRVKGHQERGLILFPFDAVDGPHPKHQIFARPLLDGDVFHLGGDGVAGGDGPDIAVHVRGEGVPGPGEVRGRGGTEAHVFSAHPVFEVVGAFLTGLVYGLFYHKKEVTLKSSILPNLIVSFVLNLFLDTLWLMILMGQGFWVLLPTRIVKCVIMFAIQVAIIPLIWNKLMLRIPGFEQ